MLMDPIKEHKQHHQETAVVGGVAMFFGIASLAISAPQSFTNHLLIINLTILSLATGVLDDAVGLNSLRRFAFQILLGCTLFYIGDIRFLSLGDIVFTGPVVLGIFALPFTIIAISGGINATNMMDGLDGLAGGLVLISFSIVGCLAYFAQADEILHLILAICSALTAFLLFNYRFPWNKTASVFMGDAGAYTLGLLLAYIFLISSQGEQAIITPVLALWIMAIPLMDIARVIWRRLRRGSNPTKAGRDHLHHLLLDAGLSTIKVVLIMHSLAILISIIGIGLYFCDQSESIMYVSFLCLTSLYFWLTGRLVKHLNQQGFQH
ncbi:MAG: undecaprenyl/decaprenyl-phosphate alpha-N-acetylglucosaminyl 1-phosphate transferase [Pseudomonadales bacterium]|nr:undecaprenyl/decaprenyl-phosphate alpha-N-acetylglucosaminyl 1-phosphate transferase [Pseudomonadales bacterium]